MCYRRMEQITHDYGRYLDVIDGVMESACVHICKGSRSNDNATSMQPYSYWDNDCGITQLA
jgi:hypothetical protein